MAGSVEDNEETARARGTHFAGRDRELSELELGLDDILQGNGRLFLITGDPGIGKSRLAGELATRASARGARVLWGRCWEGAGAPAYWPWVQILRPLVRGSDAGRLGSAVGAGRTYLAQLFPEIAEPGTDEAASLDSDSARFLLFDAAAELVSASARERPLVLILDDLHWSDRPSLLLLDLLASTLPDTPLLVVGTYRDLEVRSTPDISQTLATVARRGQVLPLRGLVDADVMQIVQDSVGITPSRPVLDSLCSLAEGNPFFVEELARLFASENRLIDADAASTLAIPEGIRDVIRRRLATLPDETRLLLRSASAVGREFSLAVLEEASEVPRERARDALWRAGRLGIVDEAPFAPGTYSFAHALVRETLYEELSPAERARVHLHVGRALERFYGRTVDAHLSELAHQFFQSVEAGGSEAAARALGYASRAAQQAVDRFAYEDAARLCAQALRSFEELGDPDDEARHALLMRRADALRRAGELERSMDVYAEAVAVARAVDGAGPLIARGAIGFEDARWQEVVLMRVPESIILLREALSALPPDETALRSGVLARLARACHFLAPPEETLPMAREAVELAEATDDPKVKAAALDGLCWSLWVPEHSHERTAIFDELISSAEEAGDDERSLTGRLLRVMTLLELADITSLDAEIATYARIASGPHQAFFEWWTSALRATRAIMDGRFDDVEHELASLNDTAGPSGTMARGVTAWFESGLGWLRGEPERVKPALEQNARELPLPSVQRAIAAFIPATFGDRERAKQAFDVAASADFADVPRNAAWLGTLGVLSACCAFIGDAARADMLYRLIEPFPQRIPVVVPLGFLTTSHWLGVLSITAGRLDDAARHLEEALELHERLGAHAWLAYTRCEYGLMLDEHGGRDERERAQAMLRDSLAFAESHGMEPIATRVREALGERVGVGTGSPSGDNVFRQEGDWWTLAFEGNTSRLNGSKGFTYLRQLLANPGRELHVLQLVALADAGGGDERPGASMPTGQSGLRADTARAEALLDDEARRSYRERMRELTDDVEEAESFGDTERAAKAHSEFDALTDELSRSYGLGGRDRRTSAEAERARVNVTRATKAAIERIAKADPKLGTHLTALVRTGTYCAYATDPQNPVRWKT